MTRRSKDDTRASGAGQADQRIDRRRPGRIETADPALIPLLRREALPSPLQKTGGTGARASSAPTRQSGLLAGTRLLTPTGYRPVETLRRGDLVATLIGRGPMFVPIQWIGRRTVAPGTEVPQPVRIRRNAVGDRMPARDVVLAPDHALYLEGRLFLAGHLVNGGSIVRERMRRRTEYWGIQLERHDVLVAENMALESLLPSSASAFSEVTAPALRIVPPKNEKAESEATQLDFPARLMMSARWVRRRLLARDRSDVVPTPEPDDAASREGLLDAAKEIRAVATSFAEIARRRGVRLQIAAGANLRVPLHRAAFRELLGAVLTHAIHGVAGGHILIGAMDQGGHIQLAVITQGDRSGRDQQLADLQPAIQLARSAGVTLELECRDSEGTTILLRV